MVLTPQHRAKLEQLEAVCLAALEYCKSAKREVSLLRDGIVTMPYMQRECVALDTVLAEVEKVRRALIVEMHDAREELQQ